MINCSLQNDPPFLLRRLVDFIFKRRALDFDMHYWTTEPVKCVYQTMLFFPLQLYSLLLQIKKITCSATYSSSGRPDVPNTLTFDNCNSTPERNIKKIKNQHLAPTYNLITW